MKESKLTEEQIAYPAPGRDRNGARRRLSVARGQRSDVLPLEKEFWPTWASASCASCGHIALHRGPAPAPTGPTERWSRRLSTFHVPIAGISLMLLAATFPGVGDTLGSFFKNAHVL